MKFIAPSGRQRCRRTHRRAPIQTASSRCPVRALTPGLSGCSGKQTKPLLLSVSQRRIQRTRRRNRRSPKDRAWRYPIKVENGLLFIEVAIEALPQQKKQLASVNTRSGCLREPRRLPVLHPGAGRFRWARLTSSSKGAFRSAPETMAELTNEPVPNHLKRWWFCARWNAGIPVCDHHDRDGHFAGLLLSARTDDGVSVGALYHRKSRSVGTSIAAQVGATFMVAGVILHQMRVFFTGGVSATA